MDQHATFLDWIVASELDSDADEVKEALQAQGADTELQFHSANHTTKLLSTFVVSGLMHGHGYRVVKAFPFPNVSVNRLKTNFGAINFIPAFQSYLLKTFPCLTITASRYDYFNLYNSLVILLPINPHVSNLKHLNKVWVPPQIPSKSLQKRAKRVVINTVLIVEDGEELWRIGGLYGAY